MIIMQVAGMVRPINGVNGSIVTPSWSMTSLETPSGRPGR